LQSTSTRGFGLVEVKGHILSPFPAARRTAELSVMLFAPDAEAFPSEAVYASAKNSIILCGCVGPFLKRKGISFRGKIFVSECSLPL